MRIVYDSYVDRMRIRCESYTLPMRIVRWTRRRLKDRLLSLSYVYVFPAWFACDSYAVPMWFLNELYVMPM